MKTRTVCWLSLLAGLLLLAGCEKDGGQDAKGQSIGEAIVKFQPSDRTVTSGQTTQWTFDTDTVGGLPANAEAFSGTWVVHAEPDAPTPPNAMCQTGNADFPALLLGNAIYTDLVLSAQIKPISGQEDQAAGLIFRVQDKDNYYILRANALEDNVNIYKYVGGQRSLIQEAKTEAAQGRWQELHVQVSGNHISGLLDSQPVVEATDNTFTAGKIGLWTKSDSVTCFDDVRATAQ